MFVTVKTCITNMPESPSCMFMTRPRGSNCEGSWTVWPFRAGAWTARGERLLVGLVALVVVRMRLPRDNQAELLKGWVPGGDAGDLPESQGSSPEL